MKTYRFISIVLCLAVCACVISGCKSSTNDIIYLNISSIPETLDPQLAQTDEELMICRNIYEGLLRKNEKGGIVAGACSSYKVEGLTYTFNLRSDAKWSDGAPVTADDFIFAFRRAVTPDMKSPFARRLKNIKNAAAILSGSANPSTLGIKALSDKCIQIELSGADRHFEEVLTTPVCMPCNQKFLEKCEGKFARDEDCVISNGSYYLKRWRTEEFGIRLVKNDDYTGDFKAKNGGVIITANSKDPIKKLFAKNSIDCAIVDNLDVEAVKQTGTEYKTIQNICWFMTVGETYTSDVRFAFLSSVSPDVYKSLLPTGFSPAYSIYPEVLQVDNADKAGIIKYDIDNAKIIFSAAVKLMEDKAFPPALMYYYKDDCILPAAKAVVAHFQQNLSAFINISPAKHPEELKNELKGTTLQFSLFPVKANGSDVSEYLYNFGSFDGIDSKQAQEQILSKQTIVPICFENTNLCYSKALNNIVFENQDGYIDFSFVTKG